MSKTSLSVSVISFLMGILFIPRAYSLDLSKVDFSYQYKESNASFQYKIAEQDGVYKLLLDIGLRKVGSNDDIRSFEISSQRRFSSSKSTPVESLTNILFVLSMKNIPISSCFSTSFLNLML